jgi:sugar phosphate isomerase/epimerase
MQKIGCQTYTWEMLGNRWAGNVDQILSAISLAGYVGIEITDKMIGPYANQPEAFARALQAHGLELVAFACASPSGFTEPDALAEDLEMADKAIRFLGTFPGAVLSLGSATAVTPGNIDEKFQTVAAFYNAAGERGRRAGVPVAFHPSSHHNTLLATRDDYHRIMTLTDPAIIGWVPDTGHILRKHPDMLDTVNTYLERVRYLHLKDVDAQGHWRMLGDGICSTKAIIDLISTAPNFTGWLVLEEESDVAAADPGAAIARNRQTIRALTQ